MNGVLIIDKPKGITSHDVVDLIRYRFKLKKVGHAGSLDPIATGALVMLLGKATKLSNKLMSDDKVYEATLKLGVKTDTLDEDGKVIEEKDASGISDEKIKNVFSKFCGELFQTPPIFSALKHKGTPLYKLARKGIFIKKSPRKIHIKELVIERIKLPYVFFRVHCSKGTYIRQLCDDIGQALGCGACMSALRRLSSGDFNVKEAILFDDLKKIDLLQLEKRVKSVTQ